MVRGDVLPEAAEVRVQIHAHTGELRALSGEGEDTFETTLLTVRPVSSIQSLLEAGLDLLQVGAGDGDPVGVVVPTCGGGVRQTRERRRFLRLAIDPRHHVLEVLMQGRRRLGGDGDHMMHAGVIARGPLHHRGVLQDQGGVPPRGGEVVEQHTSDPIRRTGPGNGGLGDVGLTRLQLGNLGVDLGLDAAVGRNLRVLQHQQDLGERGGTGGGLSVTDVGLGGSDVQGLGGLSLRHGGESIEHRRRLRRISRLGTGTVHLDVGDGGGIDAGVGEDTVDEILLGGDVGAGDGVGLGAVVGTDGEDTGLNGVMILDGVVETFEDGGDDGLTTTICVGYFIRESRNIHDSPFNSHSHPSADSSKVLQLPVEERK